jgi:chromosome segregation ATPase
LTGGRANAFELATDFNSDDTLHMATSMQSALAAQAAAADKALRENQALQEAMTEKERREKEKRDRRERMEAEARSKQEELQLRVDELMATCSRLEAETLVYNQTNLQLQGQIEEESQKTESMEDEYRAQKASLEMLENFQANLKQLQEVLHINIAVLCPPQIHAFVYLPCLLLLVGQFAPAVPDFLFCG